MKTPKRKYRPLTESIGEGCKIDRENAVIHGVKILGAQSRNGRIYTPEAMQEAADRYEGCRVNLDHPDKSNPKVARSVASQWGTLKNVKVTEEGVFGDLEYLKSHAQTEPLLEMAERWPQQFGLSHNADCFGVPRGGKTVVESVEHVRSVDVVQRPATTNGLFESEDEPVKIKLKAFLESIPEGTKHRKKLLRLLEDDTMGAMLAETPIEAAPAEMNPDDAIWEGFRSAVLAVLDSDMDIETTKTKIQAILDSYNSTVASGATGDAKTGEGSASTGGESATEGVDELRREIRALRAENKARAVLEEHNIQATTGRIKGVVAVLESADDLSDLISSFPKRDMKQASTDGESGSGGGRKKPARSAPALEAEDSEGSYGSVLPFKTSKEFAALVK